jgi:hypothetical protein
MVDNHENSIEPEAKKYEKYPAAKEIDDDLDLENLDDLLDDDEEDAIAEALKS